MYIVAAILYMALLCAFNVSGTHELMTVTVNNVVTLICVKVHDVIGMWRPLYCVPLYKLTTCLLN